MSPASATIDEPTFLDRVLRFRRQHIDDNVAEWERSRSMAPAELYEAAAAVGLTAVDVPVTLGGLGLSFGTKVRAFDVISEASMATAFSLINTQNVAANIATNGTPEQQARFLPDLIAGRRLGSTALTEPGAGSDFGAIITRGKRHSDGWTLDGEKAWITNAARSEVIVCYVQTDPGAGSGGIASVIVDGSRAGFERTPPEAIVGGHGIGAGGFRLVGYEATASELFAEPGVGFKSALAGINGARTYVASMCCAMVRASLQVAVDYGTGRRAFGAPIIDNQGLAWSLADVANQLEAGQLLVAQAIEAVEFGLAGGDPRAAVLPAAHAKRFTTRMAEPAIAACIQAMGAAGLRDEYPLGRHLASAKIANFVDGSTEMMTERIAGSLVATYGSQPSGQA